MALINCPQCTKQVSDKAASCPGCGSPINLSAPSANEPDRKVEGGVYSGKISNFGFGTLLSAESDNFWSKGSSRRRRRRTSSRTQGNQSQMSAKPHGVSVNRRIDTTKGHIIAMWMLGLFGALGFHYFAAGRFLSGSLRFLWGALMGFVSVVVALEAGPRILLFFLPLLFIPSLDIIFIGLGKFRDAFRNYIT